MQNNVSGNTILASLTAPSKNAGRDAASTRGAKDTQESRVSFRDSMDQVARMKADARRDQLARADKLQQTRADRLQEARADRLQQTQADKLQQARADKLQETRVKSQEQGRADQVSKGASASENRAVTTQQKTSGEHRAANDQTSVQPASTKAPQENHTTASKQDFQPTDAVNDPVVDGSLQNTDAVTPETQFEAMALNADLASALTVDAESAANALAQSDPEAEGVVLEPADSEAIAPLLVEAGLININGINLPPAESGLAGLAKTTDFLKEGISAGLLFSGDNGANGKAGTGNMAAAMLNNMALTQDGLSLDGDLQLEAADSSFSKLLAASREAHALLDPAPAKSPLAALTPLVEAAPRLVESAAANRGFVVQTGVPTAMGQPGWSQAVGEKVLWLAAQNLSSAELRLDPPELGQMQVRITIQNDQANVSFSSPHLVVREALDQSASRLREMFAEQGLNLVDVGVSDQSFARHQAREESNSRSGREDQAELENEVLVGTTKVEAIRLVDHYA